MAQRETQEQIVYTGTTYSAVVSPAPKSSAAPNDVSRALLGGNIKEKSKKTSWLSLVTD